MGRMRINPHLHICWYGSNRIMFLADEKLADHLLLNFRVSQRLWWCTFGWFVLGWVLPIQVWTFWRNGVSWMARQKKIHVGSIFLGCFMDYLEGKEYLLLQGKTSNIGSLKENFKFTVSSWVSFLSQFHGYSIYLIMLDWKALAA